jgi:hypothetical protein
MLATKPSITPGSLSFPGYTHPVSKNMLLWHKFSFYILHGWEKLIIIILSVLALMELYRASTFIISDFRVLQEQFSLHGTQSEEIRTILSEAIGTMLSTILNIVMALRLTISQERVSRVIELILATCLIIWQSEVVQFLQQLNYTIINQSVTF